MPDAKTSVSIHCLTTLPKGNHLSVVVLEKVKFRLGSFSKFRQSLVFAYYFIMPGEWSEISIIFITIH